MGEEMQQTQASLRSTLERAGDTLSALLDDTNNRGQAKAWLISTIASLKAVPSGLRLACLDPCSSSSSPLSGCNAAQAALLQLLMEQRQGEVAALLSADPGFLCSYFTASPANISRWFGHFSMAGIQHFKHGAKALANYALAQRSEVWHLLAWAGKHTQAPVAVAAKPHYFCELDVQRTVRALAHDCPRFWESEELQRSCRQGTWLAVDPPLAAEELQHLLHSDRSARSSQLQQLLHSFLATADWALLCTRLLPLLPDQQLASFVELLGQRQQQQQQSPLSLRQWLKSQADFNTAAAAGASTPPSALAAEAAAATSAAPVDVMPCVAEQAPLLLGSLRSSWDLQQALLANALTSSRAQLLRLLQQDDDACSQLQQLATAAQQLWQLLDAGGNAGSSSRQPRTAVERGVLAQLLRDGAPFDRPRQRLQLLLLGWLLRLHLLLAAADAAAASGGEAGTRMQQLLQLLGCSCSLAGQEQQQLLHSGLPQPKRQGQLQLAAHAAQQPEQPQQQQKQQQQPEQQQLGQQEQPAAAAAAGCGQRTPLRRGAAAAAAPAPQPGSSKRKGSSKSKKRRRRHSSSSISSGDDAAGSDVDAHSRPHSSSKRGKRKKDKGDKRKRRAKRRRRHSKSSGGSDGEGSEDLDGGGELLDLAEAVMQGRQQAGGAAAGVSAGAGRQPDDHALELLHRLARLSVGGQLWERPRWLLQLPLRLPGRQAAAGSAERESSAAQPSQPSVALCGTTAAVADAVACYWVWDVLSSS